jgi:predicted GNAT family acetyltransferase
MLSADGVAHERLAHRGAFFIPGEGRRLAEMTYSASPTMLIIDHTEVDDSLRGTGASRKLVRAAVELARAQKVKILPLCPFARHVFDRTPEYKDVLAT